MRGGRGIRAGARVHGAEQRHGLGVPDAPREQVREGGLLPGKDGICEDGNHADGRRGGAGEGEGHNHGEREDEPERPAVIGDVHGLGHAGVQGLLRHRDDEGPAAQGRGRMLVGGQLAGLRPEQERAAHI